MTPTLAEGVVWRLSQLDDDGLLVVDAVLQGLQRDPLIAPLLAGLLRTWTWEGMSANGESRGEDAQVVRLEFRFKRKSLPIYEGWADSGWMVRAGLVDEEDAR